MMYITNMHPVWGVLGDVRGEGGFYGVLKFTFFLGGGERGGRRVDGERNHDK